MMIFCGLEHEGPRLERWVLAESEVVFIASASACPAACNPNPESWGLPRISGQSFKLALPNIRPSGLPVGARLLPSTPKAIVQPSSPSDPGVWVPSPHLDISACRAHCRIPTPLVLVLASLLPHIRKSGPPTHSSIRPGSPGPRPPPPSDPGVRGSSLYFPLP